MDWKHIQNEKEKYAAYLCSREWSVLKEQVHKRSVGKCERCNVLPGNAVHHLTYERKYREQLSDLQHQCHACHDFTHDKAEFDPSLAREWCAYVVQCDRHPPVDIRWLTGVGDEVRITPLEVLRILYRHHLLTADTQRDVSEGLLQAMDGYQIVARFQWDMVTWVKFGEPRLRYDFYEESLRQIAKCTGTKHWHQYVSTTIIPQQGR